MSDLVERLRNGTWGALDIIEAADRIEQLEAELKKLGSYKDFWIAHAPEEDKI